MLKIIDTYNEITKLFDAGSFDMSNWKHYVLNISKTLLKLIQDDVMEYDFKRQILPVIQFLFENRELADITHTSFIKVTRKLDEKCETVLHDKLDCTIILYMGLCNAAGWAAKLDGEPVILLGIEKIVELNWVDEISMIGLIYHGLGHYWHFQNRSTETHLKTLKEKSLWQLYTEGMAMYFEQLMYGNPHFYHQNKNGWLDWCDKNKHRIAKEYLRRIENNENVQDFFGDWCSFEEHSDVGYYLGAEIVNLISKDCGMDSLINLKLEVVEDYLSKL